MVLYPTCEPQRLLLGTGQQVQPEALGEDARGRLLRAPPQCGPVNFLAALREKLEAESYQDHEAGVIKC